MLFGPIAMEPSEAIRMIVEWCNRSRGHPIDIGADDTLAFSAKGRWTEPDLERVERSAHASLPDSFREFALGVGQASLFVDRYGLGLEFYDPAAVTEASAAVWDESVSAHDPLRGSLLLIGDDRGLGDYFGWALSVPAPRNFDVFCHEYSPTEYVAISDEVGSWRTFEEWLVHVVESKGHSL